MATIDDVYRQMDMLLDALFRVPPHGRTAGMGQAGSFPGLAATNYHVARAARDASVTVVAVAQEINGLLKAVNTETLGRIEDRINDNQQTLRLLESVINDARTIDAQTFVRIESSLKQITDFMPTVRADFTDLRAMLDGVVVGLQQDKTDLYAKLDALRADIQALPH